MRTIFLMKVILVFFIYYCHLADYVMSHQMNKTNYLCSCFNDTTACATKDITCESDQVRWIGLRYIGFGLMQKGTNCSSLVNSPLIPVPENKQCMLNATILNHLMEKFSGISLPFNNQRKGSTFDYCKNPDAYFVANYDCVPHNPANDLELDNLCKYTNNRTVLSLSSKSYPHTEINANSTPSGSCNLTITSSKLLLRTYDNRLIQNQTLTLSYSNQTVVKSWKLTNNMTDVMNRRNITGPFTSQQFLLNWNNNANKGGGKLWIVIEAINGSIQATCQQNCTSLSSTVSTSTASPATNSSSATASTLMSNQAAANSSTNITTVSSILSNLLSTTTSPRYLSGSNPSALLSTNAQGSLHSNGVAYPNGKHNTNKTDGQPSTQTLHTKDPNDDHANLGVLIGEVLGGLFFLILLIICFVLLYKKKKKKTEPEKGTQPARNTFQRSRITQGLRNVPKNEGNFQNNIGSEKVSNFSNADNTLPPVPVGRSLISAPMHNSNHNKVEGYQDSTNKQEKKKKKKKKRKKNKIEALLE